MDIKEFAELKKDFDKLYEDIQRLQQKRISTIKHTIDKISKKCGDHFKKYFDSKGFSIKENDDHIEAKYLTTTIKLKKNSATERRGHIRISMSGEVLDFYVKFAVEEEVIKIDRKPVSFSKTVRSDYVEKIDYLQSVKSKADEIISKICVSNTDFVVVDKIETNQDKLTDIRTREKSEKYIPEYGNNIESNRFDSFEKVIREKFGG